MRVTIVNVDYTGFLAGLYEDYVDRGVESYADRLATRAETLFGVADFYSSNLRSLGHPTTDLYANNEMLQRAWAAEHGLRLRRDRPAVPPAGATGWRRLRPSRARPWLTDVLEAQIEEADPDVVLNQAMDSIDASTLRRPMRRDALLVGQHAATALHPRQIAGYDLGLSSWKPTLASFREAGMPAHLHRLGFEPRVLEVLEPPTASIDVSFVGSFSPVHSSRIAWLETLCDAVPELQVFAPDLQHVPPASPIHSRWRGPAYGRRMYAILRDSRVTLNHHGDVGPYANNLRLFEATGAGALLVTDAKRDLHEILSPGEEVVTYRDDREAAEVLVDVLSDEPRRRRIAAAGQARTLSDHTWEQRMRELVDLLAGHL